MFVRFYELTDRNAGSQNRARNSRVSFWFSAARTPLFRRIADVKYDRAASKRRFHCSDSIDIERSFLPLFSPFPDRLFVLYSRGAARLFSLPLSASSAFPVYFLPARSFLRFYPFILFSILSLSFLIISRQASPDTRALTRSYERCKSVGSVGAVSHLRQPDFLLYFLSPFFSFLIPFRSFRSLRREQVHSLSRSSFFLRLSLCLFSVLCATLTATVSFFLVVAVLFTPLPSSHERLTSHDDCHLSRSIARRRAAS